MPALSYSQGQFEGLSQLIGQMLQAQQVRQQGQYQQGELGVQRQQVGQTGAYQQGMLGIQGGQLGIAQAGLGLKQQGMKAQAVQLVNQAAQADPLGMTGALNQAMQYARSVGVGGPATQGGTAPSGQPTVGAMDASALSQALQNGVGGNDLYQYMPVALRNQVQQIATGDMPPAALARNPAARQLMALVSAVDPSFDATQYGIRYATGRAFASGQQANAIRAVNQTMNHAGHLLQNINALNNYGGPLPGVVNWVGNKFGEDVEGQTTQGSFQQTAQALASEMRKVFAASGGGGLTELQEWQSHLPLNASPLQQRSYLKNGMSLLQGAISALQDQYRRGFGPQADVSKLISPQARQMLDYITNMDPATGRLPGQPPNAGAPGEGNAPPAAIAFLKKNPQFAPQFKEKYGYLPGGIQ